MFLWKKNNNNKNNKLLIFSEDGLRIEQNVKDEDLNLKDCMDISDSESFNFSDETFECEQLKQYVLNHTDKNTKEKCHIEFTIKKPLLFKSKNNVFLKIEPFKKDIYLKYEDEFLTQSIVFEYINVHKKITFYKNGTIRYDAGNGENLIFFKDDSIEYSKLKTTGHNYSTTISKIDEFHKERKSYRQNLLEANGFVQKTKGLIGIDIFNGSCLCGQGCCSEYLVDTGETINLADVNKMLNNKKDTASNI